jgi:PAS domain S-box-containing protein
MLEKTQNHLWQLLWEYDPNGLIAVDSDLIIKLVNPAFCQLFNVEKNQIIGTLATEILGNIEHFKKVWETDEVIRGRETEYPQYHLYIREFIFPIKEENIIACIMTNITAEMERKKETDRIKAETVKKVNEVVDNQMKVAQEIAGLLGETTAETKISLLKIIEMVNQ